MWHSTDEREWVVRSVDGNLRVKASEGFAGCEGLRPQL
jgi:hypothetical protein